ncbi:cadherin-related family member 5-like isoform X2 [Takifugu flavidus]|uniref:cadherin-related family member 5-like isoform X2 n=1 Tax=Takifugu flavidus TaxID=433684 RepID=UPI0025448292|nr:cadherin-related family member 5-like isoform X2 [Takifugu flavidus]
MEGSHSHLTVTTFLAFLVLSQLQASIQAQDACPESSAVEIPENNNVGDLVTTIDIPPGATLRLNPPQGSVNPFSLNGTQLLAAIVFDAEQYTTLTARLVCQKPASSPVSFSITVVVTNVNDNPPVFPQTVYQFNVSELSPENTVLGRVEAQDLDKLDLYYRLIGETSGFNLSSPTVPEILVSSLLDYDKVKNVSLTLFVQDTLPGVSPSYNTSTTIEITILDVDNRPPWFQPCTVYEAGTNLICSSSGYTGRVTLNKKETEPLKLNPGPLYAIDGDSGINEEITYTILGGDDGNLFHIDPITGNISMQKEADTLETITLTVLAAQKINTIQVSSTSVTINVLVESLHLPTFQSPRYQGTVTGVGIMAMDMKNEPLQFLATDADYAATGGLNPNIIYYIDGSSDFSIVGGYLFMTKSLTEANLNLQVVAKDVYNDETATAELLLEVKSGPKTTTVPPTTTKDKTTDHVSPTSPSSSTDGTGLTTTPSVTTTKPGDPTGGPGLTTTPSSTTTKPGDPTGSPGLTTTPSSTTTKPGDPTGGPGLTTTPSSTTTKPGDPTGGPGLTTTPSSTTTKPSEPTDGAGFTTTPSRTTNHPSLSTTKSSTQDSNTTAEPSPTSNGTVPTANTALPLTVVVPSGGYGSNDMAALGATLGVLLCVCLAIIAFLIIHIRRDRGDWKKLHEINQFKSSLNKGLGGKKEGIQYTNDAFSKDEDGSSTRSGSPNGGTIIQPVEPDTKARDLEKYLSPEEPSVLVQDDAASQSGLDSDDKEKEVRPILTKGRRQDEGYKSVWFKEDIDPEAKEEVVIIPDSRENDSDEEDQEQTDGNREEKEEDTKMPKTRVGFKDTELDREGEHSQDDEVLNINL